MSTTPINYPASYLDGIAKRADALLGVMADRHRIDRPSASASLPHPPFDATTPVADAWRLHDVSNAADALADLARGNSGMATVAFRTVETLRRIIREVERREANR